MALASAEGAIGAEITAPEADFDASKATAVSWLFGEDQARYIVTASEAEPILAAAREAGVPAAAIGHSVAAALILPSGHSISVSALRDLHEGWLPAYMAAPARETAV